MADKEFGLSSSQLERKFYGMRPFDGEATPKFVLRVEGERKLLGIDGMAAMYAFMPRFAPDFQARCETSRAASAVRGGCPFGWVDVVSIARDELYGGKFTGTPAQPHLYKPLLRLAKL